MKLTWRADDPTRALASLQRNTHVAIVRSLKRAATSAQAVAARAIAEDMAIKQGDVKKAMEIKQGRVESEHTIALEVTGARIPLIAWVRNPQPGVRRRGGVSSRLPGGTGRFPHAFIARMASGHIGVFERTGEQRRTVRRGRKRDESIKEKFGPSIVGVFSKHKADIAAAGQESLAKNLAHELAWASAQAGAGK